MAITRILALGSVSVLIGTIGLASGGYAVDPCRGWIGGKYINLKTGKAVVPPKDAHAPPGPVGSANPEQDDVIIVIGPAPEPKRATDK